MLGKTPASTGETEAAGSQPVRLQEWTVVKAAYVLRMLLLVGTLPDSSGCF